jgi:hypothetical protein
MANAPAEKKGKPVLTWVLGGIVAVGVLFGGGFATGRMTAPESAPAFRTAGFTAGQEGQAPDGRQGFVRGEVTAVDGTTVTVTSEDGTETAVTTGEDTTVTLVSEGDASDLAVGDTVTVMGTAGEDGGIAAQSITEGDMGAGALIGGRAGAGFPGGGFAPGDMPSGMPQMRQGGAPPQR